MKMRVVAIAVALTVLNGCSSSETKTLSENKDGLPVQMEERKARAARIDALPDWVLASEEHDGKGLIAVGIGESDDLPTALKKARLHAEFMLAQKYHQELSGSERLLARDGAIGSATDYELLIDKLVRRVPLSGYEVLDQVLTEGDHQYQAYIRLRLPYGEVAKAIQQERGHDARAEMQRAFRDLEARLARRQAEDLDQWKEKSYGGGAGDLQAAASGSRSGGKSAEDASGTGASK